MPQLEIPIFGPTSGITAARAGARRIELNRAGSYAVGGTTPTLDELAALSASLSPYPGLTLRIMIRPRGIPSDGPDFIYSPFEIAEMSTSIAEFKSSGLLSAQRGDGFVFGLLRPGSNGNTMEIDETANRDLVDLASPFACVFHRAFDEILSPETETCERAVEAVLTCGFDGVLTSGGRGNAVQNAERLGKVVGLAGGRVEIIVGGGVRRGNIRGIIDGMGLIQEWFHSSCLADGGEIFDENEAVFLVKELGLLDGTVSIA